MEIHRKNKIISPISPFDALSSPPMMLLLRDSSPHTRPSSHVIRSRGYCVLRSYAPRHTKICLGLLALYYGALFLQVIVRPSRAIMVTGHNHFKLHSDLNGLLLISAVCMVITHHPKCHTGVTTPPIDRLLLLCNIPIMTSCAQRRFTTSLGTWKILGAFGRQGKRFVLGPWYWLLRY